MFGTRDGGPLNANQHWFGRDDVTELFFRDWGHVMSCFSSDHVKEKVGPDGVQFADFETNVVLMAYEKDVDIATRLASRRVELGLDKLQGHATVAQYFISSVKHGSEGQELEATLTPFLRAALEQHCDDEVWGLRVDVGVESDKFDLAAYFGGGGMPRFCLVYKIFLKDHASVTKFRRSQHSFEADAQAHFDLNASFVLFAEEALVMDVEEDIKVCCVPLGPFGTADKGRSLLRTGSLLFQISLVRRT